MEAARGRAAVKERDARRLEESLIDWEEVNKLKVDSPAGLRRVSWKAFRADGDR